MPTDNRQKRDLHALNGEGMVVCNPRDGLEKPGLAFVEVLLLGIAIAAAMVTFWLRSAVAGLLFVPYLVWVSFASVLNFTIWQLNG